MKFFSPPLFCKTSSQTLTVQRQIKASKVSSIKNIQLVTHRNSGPLNAFKMLIAYYAIAIHSLKMSKTRNYIPPLIRKNF